MDIEEKLREEAKRQRVDAVSFIVKQDRIAGGSYYEMVAEKKT